MGLLGGKKDSSAISGAMQGFLDCLKKVDDELAATTGPWFYEYDYPTMIDFVYVSHVERMLASCAYWKGLDLRGEQMRSRFPALNLWLDSFEKREFFLAFKSDYYTHVKDIPPQYGPGYDGGFEGKLIIIHNFNMAFLMKYLTLLDFPFLEQATYSKIISGKVRRA